MRKLLNQTLIYYSVFALLTLSLVTPFFYWLSQKLYLDDVDEAILLREKEFFAHKWRRELAKEDIIKWNKFSRDIKILPDTVNAAKGKIIQQVFYDKLADEWEPYRVLYKEISIRDHKAILMIRINLVESRDLIQTIGIIFLIILFILLVGYILTTRAISNKLWDPFYQSLALIENFALEKRDLPTFPSSKTLEFYQLNKALEKLIMQNIKAFEQQKEFTQNAAHELQTPLATFQSKLDILLQNEDLTSEQAAIIQQLYNASSRLLRINKNLLLLTKIENKQFYSKESIDIRKTVDDVLPYFREQATEKKLSISAELSVPLMVQANRGLTEILINNLILNAIRHNVKNGRIELMLSKTQLSVKNTGIGETLNPKKIFQRFSTSSQHIQSSGLGLTIIKKIADLNGWEIAYSYQKEEHIFTVRF